MNLTSRIIYLTPISKVSGFVSTLVYMCRVLSNGTNSVRKYKRRKIVCLLPYNGKFILVHPKLKNVHIRPSCAQSQGLLVQLGTHTPLRASRPLNRFKGKQPDLCLTMIRDPQLRNTCIAEPRMARGRPKKCQEWKGGENWCKFCRWGERVLTLALILEGEPVGNLLLVEVNSKPVLCR